MPKTTAPQDAGRAAANASYVREMSLLDEMLVNNDFDAARIATSPDDQNVYPR